MGSEFGVHSTELGSYGGGEDSSMVYAHVAAVQEPEEEEEAKPKVVVPAQHKWGESSADFKNGKFSKKESEDILKAIQDYAQEHDIPIEVSALRQDVSSAVAVLSPCRAAPAYCHGPILNLTHRFAVAHLSASSAPMQRKLSQGRLA
eukprot:23314-Eustigmatos_ZCMA.PRE.1